MQKVPIPPTKSTQQCERVIAYIDGFNLYFGLKDSNFRRFYWLNLQRLCRELLVTHQGLIRTKYFTSRTWKPLDKYQRQSVFIEALETLEDFEIYYGMYQVKQNVCKACNRQSEVHAEKMTDVNVAVEILSDAYEDKFDRALIISGDGDLVPPIRKVVSMGKRVTVAFPPRRISYKLRDVATNSLIIGRGNLSKSRFPQTVRKANGFELTCPVKWT